MDARTKKGLNILEAALLLGVVGDALLRATPWGLNVFLWTGTLLAAACVMQGRGAWRRGDGLWLLMPAAAFAAAFAWRDSPTLKLFDGIAVLVALALFAWRARGRTIRFASLTDYALGLGQAALNSLFASLPLLVKDVRWGALPHNRLTRHAGAVARGLLIALPLVLIFGALLMSADAVFEGLIQDGLDIGAEQLLSHAFITLALSWGAAGYLRGMLLFDDPTAATPRTHAADAGLSQPAAPNASHANVSAHAYTSVTDDDKARNPTGDPTTRQSATTAYKSVTDDYAATSRAATPHGAGSVLGLTGGAHARAQGAGGAKFALGAVEVGTVLGLLDALFAAFVAVQVRYFFGGSSHVQTTTGLTYAEYARSGFFELVWVAALVLPLLLAFHHLLRRESARAVRVFRALASAQLALLFVIMASAVARMRLYQSEYGLTELRLYTTAFMLWLGLVFVWFALTVLWRGTRERFACGALASAFLVLAALHLLNPDAYIVRMNAAHARAGRAFDAEYARALSADATPALLEALPALTPDARCTVAHGLLSRHAPEGRTDWRTWNFARARARSLVAARRAELDAETTCIRNSFAAPAPTTCDPALIPTTAPPPVNTTTTEATTGTTTGATTGTTTGLTTGATTGTTATAPTSVTTTAGASTAGATATDATTGATATTMTGTTTTGTTRGTSATGANNSARQSSVTARQSPATGRRSSATRAQTRTRKKPRR